ncbi:MAG TPA: ABC transporter substrate-binding protein [Thermomicrobiales bacterium]|nr:ABC transporter substrate-binding protein [Thermomicrobiales bacterium]
MRTDASNGQQCPGGTLNRRRFTQGAVAASGLLGGFLNAPALLAQDASPDATGTAADFLLAAPEDGAQSGGTLRVAFNAATANYDLFQGGSFPVLCHNYNGLVRENLMDGLKTIVPDLATAWQVSDDGLTWTFTIRQGVTFHDGAPLTSADVVATYERIVSPPEGTAITVRDRFPALSGVEAVDEFTVNFIFSRPQATFLQLLTEPGMVVYPQSVLAENGGDLRSLVAPGTGPFVYQEYVEGEFWRYTRNDNYWNPNVPYIDELRIIHLPAWPDRGTAVLTDQADLSWNVGIDTFEEGANRADTFMTHRNAAFGAYCVYINAAVEPFTDPRVRRAMHLVLDREALIQVFRSQEQINLSRWVPRSNQFATPLEEIQTLPGYRPEKDEDVAEAKRLLEEAGFADGIPDVDFLCASVPGHSELLGPAIQDMLLRNLNIQTTIRTQERTLLSEDMQTGNFTLVLSTVGSPISDFSPLGNQTLKTGGSGNFTNYSNPEFDQLLEQSDQELDDEARQAQIRQIEDLLDQDSPLLMLGYTDQLVMWNKRVKGLALELRDHWENARVETAWIEQSS